MGRRVCPIKGTPGKAKVDYKKENKVAYLSICLDTPVAPSKFNTLSDWLLLLPAVAATCYLVILAYKIHDHKYLFIYILLHYIQTGIALGIIIKTM